MQKVVRQWSDRKVKMEVPLFPNYIFVQVPPRALWSVLTISGTVRVISFDGAPAILKESEIETIRRLTAGNDTATTEVEYDQVAFLRGQTVKITSGPFAGLEGKVMDVKGKTRLFVEVKTINQVVSVEIEREMLALHEELVQDGPHPRPHPPARGLKPTPADRRQGYAGRLKPGGNWCVQTAGSEVPGTCTNR